MRLIIGAELEPDEHEAALRGYAQRDSIIEQLGRSFEPVLTQVNAELFLKRLEALQWLIAHGLFDIKVALRRKGMYHEKVGVLTDSYGEFVVFQGSANESLYALSPDFNYESINVFRSWRPSDQEHYEAHLRTSPILLVMSTKVEAQRTLDAHRSSTQGVIIVRGSCKPLPLNCLAVLSSIPSISRVERFLGFNSRRTISSSRTSEPHPKTGNVRYFSHIWGGTRLVGKTEGLRRA
jgi:hypothetical protein